MSNSDYTPCDSGCYVLRITAAENVTEKQYLKITLSYTDHDSIALIMYRSYKPTARKYWNEFCNAVMKSNEHTIFYKPDQFEVLPGKILGAVVHTKGVIDTDYFEETGYLIPRYKTDILKLCKQSDVAKYAHLLPDGSILKYPRNVYADSYADNIEFWELMIDCVKTIHADLYDSAWFSENTYQNYVDSVNRFNEKYRDLAMEIQDPCDLQKKSKGEIQNGLYIYHNNLIILRSIDDVITQCKKLFGIKISKK